jgi:hypothetical protein
MSGWQSLSELPGLKRARVVVARTESDVERRDRVPLRQGTKPRRGLNEEERAITHRPKG